MLSSLLRTAVDSTYALVTSVVGKTSAPTKKVFGAPLEGAATATHPFQLMVESLKDHGAQVPGIFRVCGDQKAVDDIAGT